MEITLEEIKSHCRIDDDESDYLLEQYLISAKSIVENVTNRKLFDTLSDNPPENALELNGDLKIAILMLIAYLFENRGGWNEAHAAPQFQLPPTVEMIVSRYKIIPVPVWG
ncbi:TPA: phage gp6-like head-tail connector protein [Pasteurella multocida]|nr:phage gp6-like head-tail connector protein [Pasteurella multocida]HDR1504936.1 phage gp6-like head-tail connector protein [Pasteurella multocida]HDR1585795.1 phage gp6-like head-tail connector protein [Pasteurella multocida]HDR1912819.1 phage gp6-like head-tail connector protein [Pasteurella multocida]